MLKDYKINREYKSVYYFLKDNGFSENFIKNLRKKEGYILVNGQIVNIRKPLNKNDLLQIESSPNQKTVVMQCILPLNIVFEDEYYLLIYKDSGISCMPNKSHYSFNLAGAICAYMSEKDENFVLRIINRLDKDTAGIIIVAKNSIAQKDLTEINKTYTAVCEGIIRNKIVIDKKIETISIDGINQLKRVISQKGKEAITYVSPIIYNNNMSLIELNLIHGRTHQIRVHMASVGHPLVGDVIYGKESALISHTALVCNKISFYHPYKKETLSFESAFPNDFASLVQLIKQ